MSSPSSVPTHEQGERGRDTPQVRAEEGDASATSLAAGGGGGVSAQPQPDALADKSPPSPGPLRLKISYHHVDDWGEEGEYHVPSPAPPPATC